MKTRIIEVTDNQRRVMAVACSVLAQIGEVAFELLRNAQIELSNDPAAETQRLADMLENLPPAKDGVHNISGME